MANCGLSGFDLEPLTGVRFVVALGWDVVILLLRLLRLLLLLIMIIIVIMIRSNDNH